MHELKNIIEPIEPMRINLIPLTIVDSIRHCTFCLKKKKLKNFSTIWKQLDKSMS